MATHHEVYPSSFTKKIVVKTLPMSHKGILSCLNLYEQTVMGSKYKRLVGLLFFLTLLHPKGQSYSEMIWTLCKRKPFAWSK